MGDAIIHFQKTIKQMVSGGKGVYSNVESIYSHKIKLILITNELYKIYHGFLHGSNA